MNILMIKVSNGKLMSHFRPDQNYSNVSDMVTACILQYHTGESADAYAICDAIELQLQVSGGKSLIVGEATGGGDFDVMQKSAVTTEVIIPPSEMIEADLQPTDDVVCYV